MKKREIAFIAGAIIGFLVAPLVTEMLEPDAPIKVAKESKTIGQLQREMDRCIAREDYEGAAKIRNIINRTQLEI